ncbi:hypothetical protein AGMMS49965_12630 [Bacteroidia bacterium]|nr:hypothetical protein AGMMS49965_12630 [Bacteroidia bacterium]
MTKIRTYKMTHATGYAPNFEGGVLTLAICKPGIREKAEVGEWIAGFTSTRPEAGSTKLGEEKLVYLAQITKKLTFDEYWEQYPEKRPDKSEFGDNQYTTHPNGYECVKITQKTKDTYKKNHKRECRDSAYFQVEGHHTEDDMPRDLSSDKVIISEKFIWFGAKNPLDVEQFKQSIRVPKYPAPYGYDTDGDNVQTFIDYVLAQKAAPDILYTDSKISSKSKNCSKK